MNQGRGSGDARTICEAPAGHFDEIGLTALVGTQVAGRQFLPHSAPSPVIVADGSCGTLATAQRDSRHRPRTRFLLGSGPARSIDESQAEVDDRRSALDLQKRPYQRGAVSEPKGLPERRE